MNNPATHLMNDNIYLKIYNKAITGIAILDEEGNFLSVNPKLCEITGYKEAEFKKLNFKDITHPEDLQLDMQYIPDVLTGKRDSYTIEKRYIHKKGHEIWIRLRSTVERNSKGEIEYVIATVEDIQKEKENEKALMESESRFRMQSEVALEGIQIHDKGEIVDANLAMAKMLGYDSAEEIIGQNIMSRHLTPEGLETALNHMKNKTEGTYEVIGIKRDGTHFPIEITSRNIDRNGKKLRISSLRDITQKKKFELQLLENEKRFKKAQEMSQMGHWNLNLKTGELFWSDNYFRVLGFEPGEVEPSEEIFMNAIYEDDKEYVKSKMDEAIKSRKNLSAEFRIKKKDGSISWGISHAELIFDDENNLAGIDGVFRDITERKLAQISLKESEKKYRSLFENINVAFALHKIITDEKGKPVDFTFLEVNKTYEEFTKLKREEIIGKRGLEVLPDLEEKWITAYGNVALTGKSITILDHSEYLDKYWEVKAYSPEPGYFAVAFTDATDSVRAGQALKESENKFMTLYNNSPDMYFSVSPASHKIITCNDTYISKTGFSREEIIGTPVFERYDSLVQGKLKELHQTFLQEGEIRNEELLLKRKNQSSLEVEVSVSSVRDENNRIIFSIASIRDISERKKAEKEIHELLETSLNIFNYSPSGMFLYQYEETDRLVLLEGNPEAERLTGLNIDNWKGKEFNEIWPNAKSEGITDDYLTAYHTGNIFESEDTQYEDHKLTGVFRIRAFRIPGEKLVVAFENITNLKKTEQELLKAKEKAEESDRLKSAFLANMSHEIRTPMNGIIGFSEMFLKKGITDEKREFYANIVINSSKQLLSIVNDILDISRIESDKIEINIERVCINELIMELFAFHKAQALNQSITLFPYKGLKDDESFIQTDKTRLRQIITNLLSNAFKFTTSGSIRFGYVQEKNELKFFVKDTGIGIDPSMHEIIFDRFRQVETSLTRKYSGTGLGLSICKRLIELLGGKIWLESKLGEGSTFYFTLPYESKSDEKASRSGFTPEEINENCFTVLIVEDEETNYLYLEEILSDYEIKTMHAHNGKEAVDICRTNPNINLVLMDIKMPVLNGYEALKEIKSFNPELPVIAQTAYAMAEDKEKAMRSGFKGYLAKPIDKGIFMEYIDKFRKLNQ